MERSKIDELAEALHKAKGYLLNAKIDLETGAPKRTALATINGGLEMIDAVLPPKSAA